MEKRLSSVHLWDDVNLCVMLWSSLKELLFEPVCIILSERKSTNNLARIDITWRMWCRFLTQDRQTGLQEQVVEILRTLLGSADFGENDFLTGFYEIYMPQLINIIERGCDRYVPILFFFSLFYPYILVADTCFELIIPSKFQPCKLLFFLWHERLAHKCHQAMMQQIEFDPCCQMKIKPWAKSNQDIWSSVMLFRIVPEACFW